MTDWLAEGLPGRAAKTVEVYRDALRPVLAVAGRVVLRDLTVPAYQIAIERDAVLRPAGPDRFQAGRSPERAADREQDPNGSKTRSPAWSYPEPQE